MQRKLKNDLVAIGVLALVAYLSAALISFDPADPVHGLLPPLDHLFRHDVLVFPPHATPRNWCGLWGATAADLLLTTCGASSVFVLTGMTALALTLLLRGGLVGGWMRLLGWTLTLLGGSALIHILAPHVQTAPLIGPAGYLGALCSGLARAHFGWFGTLLISAAVTLVGLMYWTDYLVFRTLRTLTAPLQLFQRRAGEGDSAGTPAIVGTLLASDVSGPPQTTASSPRFRFGSLRDDLAQRPLDPAAAIGPATLPLPTVDSAEESDEEETASGDPRPTIPISSRVAARQTGAAAKPVEPAPSAAAAAGPGKSCAKSEAADARQQVIRELNQAAQAEKPANHFDLPSIELLEPASAVSLDELRDDAMRKAAILERTFQQFGFNVRVVDIETGPVIAQYELELEAGLRLAKITNLADDLAIALRVPSVRIVAPIPGKNTVGIEVPNESRQTVRLREVMELGAPKSGKMKIPLFLGDDVRGEPLVVDLASLPHLLIAGRTGTGKSVCLNAIITSILMTRRPDEVRMLMIDPKMVELSGYGKLPHLMHPVVTDMRKAEAILAWAVDKMEERYALLARAGVRHITSYNQLGEQELLKRLQPETSEESASIPLSLPFIVIVADEMADLMMTAGKEVQGHIIRLAQKSRAVGIHLILATQKPTVDVITGLIKSNLPARICFQVATRTDSQVVLDSNGAEKLLGNGDMLFLWPGTSTLVRGQGTYLTDEEINSVTAAVSTGEQNFVQELVHLKVNEEGEHEEGGGGGDFQDRDDLYGQAVELVIREGRGSVSLLQRALGIGYGRAGRLIDFMEQDGVVGVYAGQKSREVIMTMAQWDEKKAGGSAASAASRTSSATSASHPLPTTPALGARSNSDHDWSDPDEDEVAFAENEGEEADESDDDDDFDPPHLAAADDEQDPADEDDEDARDRPRRPRRPTIAKHRPGSKASLRVTHTEDESNDADPPWDDD